MCFTVCFALCQYLQFYQIDTILKSGLVDQALPHYMLELKDDYGTILDPTIQQFDRSRPSVYLGPKSVNYGKFSLVDLSLIFEDWTYPLYNHGKPKPWLPDVSDQRKTFDINVLLAVNFKASELLQKEMKQKKFISEEHAEHTNLYLSSVHRAYNIYSGSPAGIDTSLLEEYQYILAIT